MLTSKALDECFGPGDFITYENIEQLKKPLLTIYEELELKSLTTAFGSRLQLSETGTTFVEESKDTQAAASSSLTEPSLKKYMTNEEKLIELMKEDMIITENGDVIAAPLRNKKCPCKSKKIYKNCTCSVFNEERKDEFIRKMTGKGESEGSKQGAAILHL